MKKILATIIIAQFFCTASWFAGNAVMPDIAKQLQLAPAYLAHLTSMVQLGFISGTLVFALSGITDRFSPTKVFFISAVTAAAANLAISLPGIDTTTLLLFRFLTGFFLAGIYPVGMKIASDHYQQGLGRSLGLLVGALVLGTSFPHFVKTLTTTLPWKYVVFSTSFLSVLGGSLMLLLVPDGPYRKPALKISMNAFARGFRNPQLRSAALGYFGHMWELYAFWAFVPVMLAAYEKHTPGVQLNIPLLSFCVIAAGSGACVFSGWVSQYWGIKRTAATALFLSGTCCLLSPLFLFSHSIVVMLVFLFTWSVAVIADSPLFSTLVAQHADQASRGSLLTIVNCIGFAVTVVSIQLINVLREMISPVYLYTILAIGPALGLLALLRNNKTQNS